MKRLFGTDGIRGIAGKFPLTRRDAFRLGRAAAHVLREHYPGIQCRLLAVRDPRTSGPFLLEALSEGLRSLGIDVFDAGLICTPAAACLVQSHRFHSGVVISASHNPPEFNGIKFFTAHGTKWPDAWEHKVESLFWSKSPLSESRKSGRPSGSLIHAPQLGEDYRDFLVTTLRGKGDFKGLKIAVDCSNGANSIIAPQILNQLKAEVILLNAQPKGFNINVRCGSQHTEALARTVLKHKCDAGLAFDGDGDRVIFTDEKGKEVDGDYLLAVLAAHMKKDGDLSRHRVVITVMANLGLKNALRHMGVNAIETPVGDRYVSEAMKKNGVMLGGEQSGHIILGKYLSTGDGLLTGLHVLAYFKREGRPFSQFINQMKKFPQVLHNIRMKSKPPLSSMNGFQQKMEEIEKSLGKAGRLLVRYSGTEPLLRIMLEGPDKPQLLSMADELAKEIPSHLR